MENQQQNAAPQGAANGAALTSEQKMQRRVDAGKLVGFIIHESNRTMLYPVSPRAAVWLLQALEGKLESHERDAIAEGRAVQVEYQYGTHRAVLGTYSGLELYDFWRGILGYCKRKWKDAHRKNLAAQRELAAAKKGGAAL
jgi:hypothetical protein